MMKISLFLFLAISFFWFGCGTSTNNDETSNRDSIEQNGHQHDEEMVAIQLNNGAKWEVDAPMMLIIRTMESDIRGFESTEMSDYKLLAGKLQQNIDALTSNCTMTGQAHDELHKWLLPFIDGVTAFSSAGNPTEAGNQLDALRASLNTFNAYFQ